MKFIENSEDFSAACELINKEKIIAVDTEFIRESYTQPLLCLVQMMAGEEIFVIDPSRVDVSLLKQPLENTEIMKIFHDARQDIENFRLYGINVVNCYDTQLAEMLLNTNETESYGTLVQRYVGKFLKKSHTLSDWAHRPLSKNQLNYACEDVCFLRGIYEKQMHKLRQLGREDWLQSAIIPSIESYEAIWFKQLSEWCLEKAKNENLPAEQVVHTRLLNSVCRKGLQFVKKVQNSRIMNRGKFADEFLAYAATVVKNVNKTKQIPKDIACCLYALLHACARQNSVCPSIIARRKDLELLVGKDREKSPCLQGWRFEIFGQHALKLLSGKISLVLENNQVVVK